MKIRSCASVIILGIGVLPLTTSLASASPGGGQGVTVTNAATTYALPFGYTLAHEEANQRVTIDITHPFRK